MEYEKYDKVIRMRSAAFADHYQQTKSYGKFEGMLGVVNCNPDKFSRSLITVDLTWIHHSTPEIRIVVSARHQSHGRESLGYTKHNPHHFPSK